MAAAINKSAARTKRTMPGFISQTEAIFIMVAAGLVGAVRAVVTGSQIRALFTGPVTLELPLKNFPPPRIGSLPGPMTGAHYSSVEAGFASLPSHEARLLAASAALSALTVIAGCLLAGALCRRFRRERIFTQGSARAIGCVGIIVAVAGTSAQALDAAARNRLVQASGLVPESGGPLYFLTVFDPAPVVIGVGMALFAAVVHRGHLQDDVVGRA